MRRSFLAFPLGLSLTLSLLVAACGGSDDDGASGGGGGAVNSGAGQGSPLPTSPKSGIATFYDYSGSGGVACSFEVGADTNVTAMNDGEYAKAASCGSCLEVVGPSGTVKVRIVDRCPGCKDNQLDLSAEVFAKIADPKAGRVPITYKVVACDVAGTMTYRFKEGSSKFWTAIQVRDHRLPISKVEYLLGGAYTDMPRSDYNYFIADKGVGDQPNGITLRVTASDGQAVEDTLPDVQAGKVVSGAKQFQ